MRAGPPNWLSNEPGRGGTDAAGGNCGSVLGINRAGSVGLTVGLGMSRSGGKVPRSDATLGVATQPFVMGAAGAEEGPGTLTGGISSLASRAGLLALSRPEVLTGLLAAP